MLPKFIIYKSDWWLLFPIMLAGMLPKIFELLGMLGLFEDLALDLSYYKIMDFGILDQDQIWRSRIVRPSAAVSKTVRPFLGLEGSNPSSSAK